MVRQRMKTRMQYYIISVFSCCCLSVCLKRMEFLIWQLTAVELSELHTKIMQSSDSLSDKNQTLVLQLQILVRHVGQSGEFSWSMQFISTRESDFSHPLIRCEQWVAMATEHYVSADESNFILKMIAMSCQLARLTFFKCSWTILCSLSLPAIVLLIQFSYFRNFITPPNNSKLSNLSITSSAGIVYNQHGCFCQGFS